jgi:hypothetical protein
MTSGQHTPEHIDYSDLNLNKVPSYTTAVRTPVRGLSYSDLQALPNYDAAVSAPPSPERQVAQIVTLDVNGHRGNVETGNIPRHVFTGHDSDAGRRFFLLQARGRA